MTSAVETIDATTVKITVSVTEAELAPRIEHAYQHIGEGISIPGFRKGKVPAKVLEQRIGKGAALEHAVNDSLAEWYGAAVEEHDLRPMGQPDIDFVKLPGQNPGDESLEFTATVNVRPQVKLPALSGITLTVAAVKADPKDVAERLDTLRARFASLTTVDRPAADGDFVTLDLSASIGGEQIDAVQGTSYQVGSGSMLDGLDEAVTGLTAGEDTSYEGPLAAGDHAGEKALIRVKVTAVKERELPVADDDFAQLASEFDTIDELKKDLAVQVEKIQANNQAAEARNLLLEHLKGAVSFDLPSSVVEQEVHRHLESEGRLQDDVHRAEVTAEAQDALRDQIVLDQLADDLEIEVEEFELIDYMVALSRGYGMDPEEFIGQMQRNGRVPAMVADVARSKGITFALRKVKVKDSAGKAVDLTEVVGNEEVDAKRRELHEQVAAGAKASTGEATGAAKKAAAKPAAKTPAAKKPAAK